MALATRHLILEDNQLHKLEADVWSRDFVRGYLFSRGVREPVEVRYRGGHTRVYPKRSYEIVVRGTTLHLNAEYDDPSLMRNALSFRLFEWLGVPAPRTRHCHLMLNGSSLGVYLEIEAVDRHFFSIRNIPVRSLIYAVNGNANFELLSPDTGRRKGTLFNGYTLQIGGSRDRRRWTTFISNLHRLKGNRLRDFLARRIDAKAYVRWLAGAVFTGNYDGFDQNYAIYEHGSRHDYRILPWDYEGTWGRNCFGRRVGSDLVSVAGYNTLTQKLLGIRTTRELYKAVLREGLGEVFTERRIMPVVMRMYDRIAPYMNQDMGRKWPISVFHEEPAVIRNYIRERRVIVADAITDLKVDS